MRISIHIGTEKTGSSYVQCKLAASRAYLWQRAIWFPVGKPFDEKSMASGRISGGNAGILADLIHAENWEGIAVYFDSLRQQAEERKATHVVLSSELLLNRLAQSDRFVTVCELLEQRGFVERGILLILRDPVDQLVSLYKHRAKEGDTGDIAQWVDSGYELPEDLRKLRLQLGRARCDFQVRLYKKSGLHLDKVFFEDWLGVAPPVVDLPKVVNPSLTFSELRILRSIALVRPDVVQPFHQALAGLDREKKSSDPDQNNYARSVAADKILQAKEEWDSWSRLLGPGESLELPVERSDSIAAPREFSFSVDQLEAIAAHIADVSTVRFLVEMFWRTRLRPFLGRIARVLRLKS